MYADIIVDISQEQLDKTFQYRIPPELENEVQIGVMVQIPFGRGNRLLTGYVIGIGSTPKIPAEKIKDIDSVSQSGIQAVGRMIQLAAWLKKQYGSTMNQALKTVLPVKEKVRQKEKRTVRLAFFGNNNILWLNITVYNMVLMCCFHTVSNLNGNADCLFIRKLSSFFNIFFQGNSLNQLHDNVVNSVFFAYIINIDNIRV